MQPLITPLNHDVVENVVIKVMDGADHAQKVKKECRKKKGDELQFNKRTKREKNGALAGSLCILKQPDHESIIFI